MIGRVFHYARERRAKDASEAELIRNAIVHLDRQRLVALKTFGASDPHLKELADEREGLLAQARELGAAWA